LKKYWVYWYGQIDCQGIKFGSKILDTRVAMGAPLFYPLMCVD